MKILVTGANGFIGRHLCPALALAGWQVSGVVRQGSVEGLTQVWPDLNLRATDLQGIDVVVHLAGLAHAGAQQAADGSLTQTNVETTVALYQQAVAAGVKKFIWLSSIKVLGEGKEQPYAVTDTPAPIGAYALSKAQGEEGLLSVETEHTELVIVRPPLVYGAGVKANFLQMMRLAVAGLPLPLAAAQQPRAWLSVNNLVHLLCHITAAAPGLSRGVWHARDAEEVSTSVMVRQLAGAAGQRSRQWYVSYAMVRRIAGLVGRRAQAQSIFATLRIDMQATCEQLGWQPPYSQREEIAKAVAWYRAR